MRQKARAAQNFHLWRPVTYHVTYRLSEGAKGTQQPMCCVLMQFPFRKNRPLHPHEPLSMPKP